MFPLPIQPFLCSDHASRPGIIAFDYLHTGRSPVVIEVDVATHQVSYINPCGLRTNFDAEIIEKGDYRSYRVDDTFWHDVCLFREHRFLFRGLHSVFGVRQPIEFTKVGAKVWKTRHPKYQDFVYLLHKEVVEEEPIRHADPSEVIPLSWRDHDFQML